MTYGRTFAVLACLTAGFVLALGALDLTLPSACSDEGEVDGISWSTDLEAARAQAKEEGRPLLVVFR